MTIYRIQDRSGRGPWKPGFSNQWVAERAESEFATLIPWPLQFGTGIMDQARGLHIGCGCRTPDQLKRWFLPEEYRKLLGFGYRAVELDADRILAESDIQCVFATFLPIKFKARPFDLYPE